MAAASNTAVCNYRYMKGVPIDHTLKCSICIQPYQQPVSLHQCSHTFCEQCIEKWLKDNRSCPICRKPTTEHMPHYSPPNTDVVLKQLNQLRVQCKHCGQVDIQRGNFSDHEAKCNKKKVSCSLAGIQCPCTGPQDKQAEHEVTWVCQKLQSIIYRLQNQLKEQSDKLDVVQKDLNLQISSFQAELHQLKETLKDDDLSSSPVSSSPISLSPVSSSPLALSSSVSEDE